MIHGREPIDENYLYNQKSSISSQEKLKKSSRKVGRKNRWLLILLGGHVKQIPDQKFIEVLGSSGTCDLPDGWPAPMPTSRIGHAVASTSQSTVEISLFQNINFFCILLCILRALLCLLTAN